MFNEIEAVLEKYLNKKLSSIVISNPKDKNSGKKIVIRPVLIQNELKFQESEYKGSQVFHTNLSQQDQIQRSIQYMESYRQLDIFSSDGEAFILKSKKGRLTIKEKKPHNSVSKADLSHNRAKKYILDPNKKVEFLVDLGIQTREGRLIHSRYNKFKQINRFLEIIEDVIPYLPRNRALNLIDFGCGKSYLTFAMYYYLSELCNLQVRITGLDLKADVIADCGRLAEKYGYEGLNFQVGDIKEYESKQEVDMVVCLHACDTATDYALDQAIRWHAKVILAVPCCQHELNEQIKSDLLKPLLQYGILKERMAALLTDGLRGSILQNEGYQVQIMEFIDMEHTPKNILIRAVRKSNHRKSEDLSRLTSFFQVEPKLAVLRKENRKDELHA